MFIIRCSNCGFEITDEKQIRLYGGVEVALKIVSIPGSPIEKRRQIAQLFNQYGVPCPKCRKKDIWTWL
ncbi:hypothetical protein SAMN06265182_2098 [Persephonella hydrogeniphila]|uniref:Uncharacterized protein n=1 Tax=Persephonella hydrogeniphila TaxID=198703 RepID=A0A285NRS0_9AQUI|nr:hypothetical protein [Persephonella hydrogeniphila]SNZ11633.1 hypothetical protein SAMN06265182_2098 [Persephonella hydrogeniphila]